jgi:hypothetical protein
MTKQQKIIAAAAVVILMAASFWGGTLYAKQGTSARGNFGQFGMGNGTFMRTGAGGFSTMGGRASGSVTSGEVLSQDGSSITLKLMDGGTKIVLLSASTTVSKTSAGSVGDLSPGTSVFVMGTQNSDGSITAQSVQLRPAGAPSARDMRP